MLWLSVRGREQSVSPLVAATVIALVVGVGWAGFCLDQVPAPLQETGFTALSALTTELACVGAGYKWCPLTDRTDVWKVGGVDLTFYLYSACCTGRQGAGLLVDAAAGLPTCEVGKSASKCSRSDWHAKLLKDLLGPGSGYNVEVTPSVIQTSSDIYGGLNSSAGCVCSPDEAACKLPSADHSVCLLCDTDAPCSGMPVELSINFFKIQTIDVQSSQFTVSSWVRQSWTDSRLSYDYQCYGGVEYFEVMAEAGSLTNSRIWTPDIELYNSEEVIWQGSLSARQATVWSCWDKKPSRGGCGYVWWSRPGLLKALCSYQGLMMFPYDVMSCEIEFGGWNIDGRHQDVIPRRVDGGVSWTGRLGIDDVQTGVTAGALYQDFAIQNITVNRVVAFYDCCPKSPFPELIYTITFARANDYYTWKLVTPPMTLALVSFIAFWLHPESLERIGFGIIIMLIVVVHEGAVSSVIPVTNEKLFLEYVRVVCFAFAQLSLLESALVISVYQQKAANWYNILVPLALRSWIQRRRISKHISSVRESMVAAANPLKVMAMSKEDARLRIQVYRRLFYELDSNFTDDVFVEDVLFCGRHLWGSTFDSEEAFAFLMAREIGTRGVMRFTDFVVFCESFPSQQVDTGALQTASAVLHEVLQRRRAYLDEARLQRAQDIDRFSRWMVPSSFFAVLAWLFAQDAKDLEEQFASVKRWELGLVISLGPIVLVCVASCVYSCLLHGSVGRFTYFTKAQPGSSLRSMRTMSGIPCDGAGPGASAPNPEVDQGETSASAAAESTTDAVGPEGL